MLSNVSWSIGGRDTPSISFMMSESSISFQAITDTSVSMNTTSTAVAGLSGTYSSANRCYNTDTDRGGTMFNRLSNSALIIGAEDISVGTLDEGMIEYESDNDNTYDSDGSDIDNDYDEGITNEDSASKSILFHDI